MPQRLMHVASALSGGMMRLHLGALHSRGQSRTSATEPANPEMIALGATLREASLDHWRNRQRDSGWTVLLIRPPSLAGAIWFGDLHAGMRHLGAACRLVDAADMRWRRVLEEFKPNLILGLESAELLAELAHGAMREHKLSHGCVRLLIPTRDNLFAGPSKLTAREHERLAMTLRGDGADAYFSLYEPELYQSHFSPWFAAGLRYLPLPQACNPLRDYPRGAERDCDYVYYSVSNPARVACAWEHTRSILVRHRGLWGGASWGFGLPDVPPDAMPDLYARARIALAPLIRFLRRNPAEISQRVFAAAACGAFQITSRSPVTQRFFAGDELLAVDSPQEFADAFEHFVRRRDDRDVIAARALRRVFGEHTVFHRASRLLQFAGDFVNP
jgi:Glycosyl transferases group 1